jgi:hypothetical protein
MSIESTQYNTAVSDGMPPLLAKFMVAQSKHETGNYTSRFFTIGHNGFGYSYNPNSPWQLDRGGPNADNGVPIAQYANIQNSVHEVTHWIKRRQSEGIFPTDLRTIQTPGQYAQLLKNGSYYQDTVRNYANSLLRWFNSLPPLGGLSIVPIAIGIILLLSMNE